MNAQELFNRRLARAKNALADGAPLKDAARCNAFLPQQLDRWLWATLGEPRGRHVLRGRGRKGSGHAA